MKKKIIIKKLHTQDSKPETECAICGKIFKGAGHKTEKGVLCDSCYNEERRNFSIKDSLTKKLLNAPSYRGCRNVKFLSHGDKANPEIYFKDHRFDYYQVDDHLTKEFNDYCDDCGVNKNDENEFNKYVQMNAEPFLDSLLHVIGHDAASDKLDEFLENGKDKNDIEKQVRDILYRNNLIEEDDQVIKGMDGEVYCYFDEPVKRQNAFNALAPHFNLRAEKDPESITICVLPFSEESDPLKVKDSKSFKDAKPNIKSLKQLIKEEDDAIKSYQQKMELTDDEDEKALYEHILKEEIEHKKELIDFLRKGNPNEDLIGSEVEEQEDLLNEGEEDTLDTNEGDNNFEPDDIDYDEDEDEDEEEE